MFVKWVCFYSQSISEKVLLSLQRSVRTPIHQKFFIHKKEGAIERMFGEGPHLHTAVARLQAPCLPPTLPGKFATSLCSQECEYSDRNKTFITSRNSVDIFCLEFIIAFLEDNLLISAFQISYRCSTYESRSIGIPENLNLVRFDEKPTIPIS